MRNSDSPMGQDEPPEAQQKIMHANFKAQGMTFMASDGQLGKTVNPEHGNVSISLTTGNGAESDRIFMAMSAGGNIGMPMGPAFWGGRFGMVTDSFGTAWLISAP